jgi:hypothetical protein
VFIPSYNAVKNEGDVKHCRSCYRSCIGLWYIDNDRL